MSVPPEACNGTAADLCTTEEEIYDYQMHTRMCKKIAQLTKVIYSLNTKNEEQEATLQTLLHITTDTADNIQLATSQHEEDQESTLALRNRLLSLQTTLEEVEAREQRSEADHAERLAALTHQVEDLRQRYHLLEMERDDQSRLHRQIHEEKKHMEDECRHLRRVREENREREEDATRRVEEERKKSDERQTKDIEERKKAEEEWEKRLLTLRCALTSMEEDKGRLEEEWEIEREKWKTRIEGIERERREEQEAARKTLHQSLNEHISQWQQREQENCKYQNSLLQQRLKKTEAELQIKEEKLIEYSRKNSLLQATLEELEEQLENCHHRVADAERVTKKAEEELAVAKERLLLQENELQNKSEELLNQSSDQVRVSAEVEDLRSQLSRLNIRNKELELQNSSRSNDHARMLKQHADALSSMRLELQRAHAEEIQRLHQEVEKERFNNNQELEEEKKRVQNNMEEEKVRLKEKLRKALEELICKHASEFRQAQALLENERQQAEECKKTAEEEKRALESEKEELQKQLQCSIIKIHKLENGIQVLEEEREKSRRKEEEKSLEKEKEKEQEKEKELSLEALCNSEYEKMNEELKHAHHSIRQMQVDFALEKDQLQREVLTVTQERDSLQQSGHSVEERLRLYYEKQFSDHVADLQKDKEKEIQDINLHWEHRVEELQRQIEEKEELFQRNNEERERSHDHDNKDIEKRKLEIQKNKEINSLFRAQLYGTIQEKQELQVVQEEDEDEEAKRENEVTDAKTDERGWHQLDQDLLQVERLNHQHALLALEKHASEELQAERQHLHTQYKLQLEKQKAELTQQHTEWVRQVTQRHMKQIEDLQNELQTHTEIMALQKDLKQQNRLQSLERQLDERNSEMQELKRDNDELRERVHELITERKSSVAQNQKRSESPSNSWKGKSDESRLRDEVEGRTDEKRSRRDTAIEERMEMKSIASDFTSAQTQLHARISACETEKALLSLKEREEMSKRRVEDLHVIAKLQDKLNERDQLIKRLVEDLHQVSQHPSSSDWTVKSNHTKTPPGGLTPSMKRKVFEDIQSSVTSKPGVSSVKSVQLKSSQLSKREILPSQTQHPVSPHPEAKATFRHTLSPTYDLVHQVQLNNSQHIRAPSERRVLEEGTDGQGSNKQEWYTKYFSF